MSSHGQLVTGQLVTHTRLITQSTRHKRAHNKTTSTCLHAVRRVTGQLADTPTRGLPTRGLDDSRTGHLADWSTRALVNSRTGQVADWTTRRLADAAKKEN